VSRALLATLFALAIMLAIALVFVFDQFGTP
jgi:hypothetical protein